MIRGRVIGTCLIIFLESKLLCALPEATAADVQTILADHTTTALADPAAPLEGALGVCTWVLGNEVDRHVKGHV